jgi:hypothetical protein
VTKPAVQPGKGFAGLSLPTNVIRPHEPQVLSVTYSGYRRKREYRADQPYAEKRKSRPAPFMQAKQK